MPNFMVTDKNLAPVTLADTSGVRVFVAVPSLDTPVCDSEVRTFNQQAAQLNNVTIWVVSMDLPFAQSRWCGAAGVEKVQTVSDYKDRSFGNVTGCYIQELGLLARAVFVVDSSNKVTHVEYVPEVTDQPDFTTILEKVKQAK